MEGGVREVRRAGWKEESRDSKRRGAGETTGPSWPLYSQMLLSIFVPVDIDITVQVNLKFLFRQ
jgi:hypothetical protein